MISVIIPVFNGEKTIERTLQSIAGQSYGDFEVIIVNDGSTDRTEDIVREFINKDRRFSLINQDNAGVSAARNKGLEYATRKYVTFIDADDILPEDSFRYMHQIAVINDADTIVGMYERTDGTETHINGRSRRLAEKSLSIDRDDLDMIHTWSLWNKWFSRKIISDNAVCFEKCRHLEDAIFVYSYLRYAENIFTCPYVVYRYVKPLPAIGSTTTQRINKDLLKDAKVALKRIEELTACYGEDFHRELIYRYLNSPVVGDYYRRIWRLDDKTADSLAEYADSLLALLDERRRNRIVSKNKDLFTEDGSRFLLKSELKERPLVAVYATEKMSKEGACSLITGLYDQSEVSFRVLADRKHADSCSQFEHYENFRYNDSIDTDAIKWAAEYAAIFDRDLIYNHGSLRAMVKALEEDKTLDFAGLIYEGFDGKDIYRSPVIQISYEDNEPGLDCIFANKLFRVDSPAFKKAVADSGISKEVFRESNNKRLVRPMMLSFDERVNDPRQIGNAELTRLYKKTLKKKRPSVKRRIKNVIKRILLKDKKGKQEEKKKPKLSVSADYYLNSDIDPDLIVIEGLGKWPKGSALYMLRELRKPEYARFRICFVVKADTAEITRDILEREGIGNVTIVTAGSREYKKALFTAGYLFNEVDFPNWWTKKPGQLYVNIWHGTPLKTLTKKTEGVIHRDATSSRNFTMADYMLFANNYSIEHILMDSDCGRLTGTKGLMLGYPRTSVLFDKKTRESVRSQICDDDKTVIVWMPTWNNDATTEATNAFLEEMDSKMTDDMLMLVNLHHKSLVTVDYSGLKHIKPFPAGFDTYEVLAATDVLVTDYSSVFFDFAACGRKIILHCPDIDGYKASRGFNMDIRDLPFPITVDTDELIEELNCGKRYDDSEFRREFNAFDSGRNTELVLRSMLLGDFSEVEIRSFEKEESAIFLIADSFEKGKILDILYELSENGQWTDNVYLSFQEKVADAGVENVYPLIKNVPIFATKGKPLTVRTERNRLYNTIDIKRFVLLDPADHGRINAFACFSEEVLLVLTKRQLDEMRAGNKEMIKAVKSFNRYGDGIYTLNEEDSLYLKSGFGIDIGIITDTDSFKQQLLTLGL